MNTALRILVVEDNPADVELIREMLPETGAVRFAVESVSRLSEALARLEGRDVDIVLLDLGLPDSQGLQTLHRLRQAAPDVAVIVLTGIDDDELSTTAMREGAQDYLVKGQVDGSLLVRSTRYALERQRAAQQTDEALARVAQEWQRTFDSMTEAVWILDNEQRVVRTNKAAATMLHCPCSTMLGRHCWEIVHGTTQSVPDCPLARARKSMRRESMELQMGKAWFSVTTDPFLDAAGQFAGAVHIISDITARKNMEVQLNQAQKLEAVGRLAGGVAHDFNNKLQIVLGSVEMILNSLPPDDPIRSDLGEIQHAARRSAELTRQLLAFSRRQAIAPEVLNLNAAIAGSLKMVARLIGENVRMNFMTQGEPGNVLLDPSQLDQILANLAVNARDAIAGTGRIFIEARNCTLAEDDCRDKTDFVAPGEYVLLTFRDDGAGMPPEIQEHIFEPFFTTKETGKGTGLGLATVYGIVKQNHGAITVQSAPGQGTAFGIYLPRVGTKAPNVAEGLPEPVPAGTETVLLVEDEEPVLHMVWRTLAGLGYVVLTAAAPAAALRLCTEYPKPIHLLLADVIMPGMGGKELSENIRKLRPDIRVLFMSGYPADVMEQHGHLEPGLQILGKPFTIAALAQRVRAVLDAPPAHGPQPAGTAGLSDDDGRGGVRE